MSKEQILILSTSWDIILPHFGEVMENFFNKMDELAPNSTTLLDSERELFTQKLKYYISRLIEMQDKRLQLTIAIQEISHLSNKTRLQNYPIELIGVALLWAISKQLGNRYTPKIDDAWQNFYFTIYQLIDNENIKTEKYLKN